MVSAHDGHVYGNLKTPGIIPCRVRGPVCVMYRAAYKMPPFKAPGLCDVEALWANDDELAFYSQERNPGKARSEPSAYLPVVLRGSVTRHFLTFGGLWSSCLLYRAAGLANIPTVGIEGQTRMV